MRSTLIVARMNPGSSAAVADIFGDFDRTEMPDVMGTVRRELFSYQGLYFHLQDFESGGPESIEGVRDHPLFVRVSSDLKPYIGAYDPETWRSPKDAMASSFYRWER